MSKKVKISVCIPSYNSAKTIRESIESAKSQNYPLMEILVVDDLSTDNTVAICKEFHDVRVIVNEKNMGIGYNLVKCMKEALGRYVVFLCSDDIFADRNVVGDIVNIFDSHSRVGMINRPYYQFMNGFQGAVMEVREKNIMMSSICPSGIALVNQEVWGTNEIFIELPTIISQYLNKWEWTTMDYDTVAVRLHAGGNTGTLTSYYKSSPVVVLSKFFGKQFKYHLGLIQMKNRAPKLLWAEIRNTLKLNSSNWYDPFFWFCVIVAVCVPQFILRAGSDFYRHRINRHQCSIIKRQPIANPIYPKGKAING